MAVGNVIFAVLTALVAVNFIFAEANPLEPGDFPSDQIDGNVKHEPPSKVNDNEKEQEGTKTLLSDYSPRGAVLTKSCNVTRGPDYCANCIKAVHCLAADKGIVTTCYNILPYCNKGKCSDSPGIECKSG